MPASGTVTPRSPSCTPPEQPPYSSSSRQPEHRCHDRLAANHHSTCPVSSRPPQRSRPKQHFACPSTSQTVGSRSLIASTRRHFRCRAAGKRYGKGYVNGRAMGEQTGALTACSLAAQRSVGTSPCGDCPSLSFPARAIETHPGLRSTRTLRCARRSATHNSAGETST